MGKLLGLPMGVGVCYPNHAAADQNSADNLLLLLGLAGCNYFMGVPCADDVMLNYQSTSYHDAVGVRRLLGLRPAPEFTSWLEERGIFRNGDLTLAEDAPPQPLLRALVVVEGGGNFQTCRAPNGKLEPCRHKQFREGPILDAHCLSLLLRLLLEETGGGDVDTGAGILDHQHTKAGLAQSAGG